MDSAVVVAWAALGLTVLVQAAAYAFFLGNLGNKVDSTKQRFDVHTVQDVPQAHGCPFYQPKHSEPS